MTPVRAPRYQLFEVVGMELEYVVIDSQLRPRCLLEDAFKAVNGARTSEIEYNRVGFSNELAAHVFEIKTMDPLQSLASAEAHLVEGLRYFATVLEEQFGARLLPTGMHPFMTPQDTELWRRAGRSIYETYGQIFNIRNHGWLNVQATHVNLPFGSEADTVILHNAIACLLPYLPALAASSPIYEGDVGPSVDNRLEFYKRNQQRIPQIAGQVIPEYITSFSDYRRKIFRPIYQALETMPNGRKLRHEWVNSRGAIMRFSRQAIEIKALDVQECVRADIAIAIFVRGALRHLVRRLKAGMLELPEHQMLVDDLNATIRDGSRAQVQATHLRPPALAGRGTTSARAVLGELLDLAYPEVDPDEQPYLATVDQRIRRGNLSERITYQLQQRGKRKARLQADVIREIYEELIDCLEKNRPWEG